MTEAESAILAKAIENIATVAANNDLLDDLEIPAQLDIDFPEIIGVSDGLKSARPDAPVTSAEKRMSLILAVNKAKTDGEHAVLAGLAKNILGTVSGFTGLARFFT